MAINREQLRTLPKGVRRYETETMPDGSILRARTLLRGERRRRSKFFRDKKGEFDQDKFILYGDDVYAAFCLVDDEDNLLLTPEEALAGFFDEWDRPQTDALVRLLVKIRQLDEDEDKDGETLDDALKNSDATPGTDSSGVSADGTESE